MYSRYFYAQKLFPGMSFSPGSLNIWTASGACYWKALPIKKLTVIRGKY